MPAKFKTPLEMVDKRIDTYLERAAKARRMGDHKRADNAATVARRLGRRRAELMTMELPFA